MKKLFRQSLYLIAALAFFASCSDDAETPAPTVKIMNPPAATIDTNGELTYTVEVKADEKIEKIVITKKVGTSTNSVLTKTTDFYTNTSDILVYSYTVTETSGDVEFTFTVTDKAGKVAAESHKITVTPAAPVTTPLEAAQNFEFKRECGAAATGGLADFGLTWTENSATAAIIKNGADKLVVLTAADWAGISTKEDLKAKVDAATGVEDYRGVSSTAATKDYDEVIATKKGDAYFILNVKKSTVVSCTSGTTITITGQSKK